MKRSDNNGECFLANARKSMLQSLVNFCVATSDFRDSEGFQTLIIGRSKDFQRRGKYLKNEDIGELYHLCIQTNDILPHKV